MRMIRCLSPFALLLLLVTGVYWTLAFTRSYVWFDHYDLCQLEIPRLQFIARSLHAGHFPLWDPHVWAGLPVLGSGQPGPVYPLNLLFVAIPLRNGFIDVATLNWWFIAIHFVAACSCFLLCRDLSLSRPASLIAAMAWSCGGYVGSIPWLDNANGASVAPIVLLFAIRIWSGRRVLQSAALGGLFLGLSWLSGHHETPLILSYAVLLLTIALWGFRTVRTRRLDMGMPAGIGLAVGIAALISAMQTLPLYEFGHNARRWAGAAQPIGWQDKVPYRVHAEYSLPWKGILGLLKPTPTPEAHTTVFVGVVICALAVIGVTRLRRNPPLQYVAWLGAGGLVYSLGANTPFHRLAYLALPMLDKARTPVRGMFLVSLIISVLAARGAEILLEKRDSRRRAFLIVAAVVGIFVLLSPLDWVPRMYPSIAAHYLEKGLAAAGALLLLILWRSGKRVIRSAALLAAVLTELTTVAEFRVTSLSGPTVCAASMLDRLDLMARLRREADNGRITVNWVALMSNPGDSYGFDQLESFVAGVPSDILRLPLWSPRIQQLMGVTRRVEGGTIEPALGPPFPRSWVVHKTITVNTGAELNSSVADAANDLRRTAVLFGSTVRLANCPGDEPVSVTRPDSDRVFLRTTLACRGLVVLSDTAYPGWEASVDQKPASILEVDGALRGVEVDAGFHQIEMRYRPVSVRTGLFLSIIGLIGCSVLTILSGRRSARRHDGWAGDFHADATPVHRLFDHGNQRPMT